MKILGIVLMFLGVVGMFAAIIAGVNYGWIQNLESYPWAFLLSLGALFLLLGNILIFTQEMTTTKKQKRR